MEPILALNAFDMKSAPQQDAELMLQLQRRARLFGAASVLFYQHPLQFVRGQGCWLYDEHDTAYLDAYNNVPSVGHCHPRVVEAAARQLGQLNIHNRYLNKSVLDYAERLLAKFPPQLSNIAFTCTGSESNDLALRLAASFTGRRGVIVTEAAYHGNTQLMSQVSPSSHRHWIPAPHVRAVPAPLKEPAEFASHVAAAIKDLESKSIPLSALLIDSIFSSDGVCPDPIGFLLPAIEIVHAHGGLFIADEVQPGFGRTGAGWWGFQRHAVQPDIVTMGKPMGNGYPLAALVTRPEILQGYCSSVGYFNTFASSPVAAAVGDAVLDVIEQEDLIVNADRVGTYLRAGLEQLASSHSVIQSVRGAGLYIGVQISLEKSQVSAAQATKSIVNGLRDRQVLIGAAGRGADVLKIRPPLCFSNRNADTLLAALDDVLTKLTTS